MHAAGGTQLGKRDPFAAALQGYLGLPAVVETFRFEQGFRPDLLWKRILANVSEMIDASPATLGPLPVGVVGDHQGAVALDDEVGGLERIRILAVTGGEIDFFHRCEP